MAERKQEFTIINVLDGRELDGYLASKRGAGCDFERDVEPDGDDQEDDEMTAISTYFTLPPDWAEAVKYSRAWRTSIITTAQGEEQRSALWTWPRRSIEYSVMGKTSAESNYIKRKLFQGQGTIFGVPLWTSQTTLSSEATAGRPMVVVVAATGSEFVVGGQMILLGE